MQHHHPGHCGCCLLLVQRVWKQSELVQVGHAHWFQLPGRPGPEVRQMQVRSCHGNWLRVQAAQQH